MNRAIAPEEASLRGRFRPCTAIPALLLRTVGAVSER
jgi:hypothetical protein